MKRLCFFMVAALLANVISPALLGGVPSHKAVYRGGTVAALAENTEGAVTTTNEQYFSFSYKKGRLTIPYERVNFLEYGQKAGRRLGLAIAVSPILLLSKKRRHYLTINFLDDQGRQQAMVLELGKGIVRATLASLEARTGRKVEFQDDNARKAGTS
ncbi:MAG TPA: hypothetical protein VEU62_07615 [Bryobacterales bacterium]|nr:hypothetical protein [Bryobacterales bacterium]